MIRAELHCHLKELLCPRWIIGSQCERLSRTAFLAASIELGALVAVVGKGARHVIVAALDFSDTSRQVLGRVLANADGIPQPEDADVLLAGVHYLDGLEPYV